MTASRMAPGRPLRASRGALGVAALTLVLAGCDRRELVASWNQVRGDAYPLDDRPRDVEGDGGIECDREGLVRYRGEALKYDPPVLITPAFQARLERFEAVVIQTAIDVYGRAPKSIENEGAFSCRAVEHRPGRLSEHALGNAIDVTGFDFAALPKGRDAGTTDAGTAGPALPPMPELRRGFRVRVDRHWEAGETESALIHQRFLRTLTDRLRARDDIFRTLLGPAQPGHSAHFHFDVAPWRFVNL